VDAERQRGFSRRAGEASTFFYYLDFAGGIPVEEMTLGFVTNSVLTLSYPEFTRF